MMRDNRKINIETDFFDDEQCMYLDGQQPTAPDFLLRKDQAAITLYNALDTIRLQRLINGFNSISSLFKLRIKFSKQNFNVNKFQHRKARTNQYGIQKSNFIQESEVQQNYYLKSGRSEHKKKSQSLDDKYSNNNNFFREERRKILNSIAKTLSQHQEERSLSNSKNKIKQSNSKQKNSPNKPSKEARPKPIKKEQNLQINHRIERLQRLMNNIRREKQIKQPTIVHQKKIISTMPKKDKSKQHLRIFVQELQSIRKQVVEIKKLNKQILHHSQSRASHSSPSSRIRREQDSQYTRHRELLRSQVLQNIHRSELVHHKNSTQNKSQRMSKIKELYNSSKKPDIEQNIGNQKFHPKQRRNQQQVARDRSRGGSRERQRDQNLYNNIYQHRSLVQSQFKNAGQKQKHQKMQNQRQNTWQHISQLQKPSSHPLSQSKQRQRQRQNIEIVEQKQQYHHINEQKRVVSSNPMLGSPKILNIPQQFIQKIHKQPRLNTEMSESSNQTNTIKKTNAQIQIKKSTPQLVPKIDLKALTQQKVNPNRIPPNTTMKNQEKQQKYESTNNPNTNNIYKYNSPIPNNLTQYPPNNQESTNTYNNMRVHDNYHQVDDYKHRMGEIKETISLSHNSKFNSLANSPNSSAFSYRQQQHSHREHPYSYRDYNSQKPISIEPQKRYEPEPTNINYNSNRNQQIKYQSNNKADYNLYYAKYPPIQPQPSTNDVSTMSYKMKPSSNITHSNPELIQYKSINISTHPTNINMNSDNYGLAKYQFSSQQIPKTNQINNTNNRSHTGPSDYTDPAILRMFNLGPYKKHQLQEQDPSNSNRFTKFKQTVQSVLDDELSENNTFSFNTKSNNDYKPLPSNYTFSDNYTYTYSKGSSVPTSIAKLQQEYMSVINGDGDAIYDSNMDKMTPMKKKPSLEQMMSEYNKRSGDKGSQAEQLQYEEKYGNIYSGYR